MNRMPQVGCNPFRVVDERHLKPRVAPRLAGQPWALLRNPFGIPGLRRLMIAMSPFGILGLRRVKAAVKLNEWCSHFAMSNFARSSAERSASFTLWVS